MCMVKANDMATNSPVRGFHLFLFRLLTDAWRLKIEMADNGGSKEKWLEKCFMARRASIKIVALIQRGSIHLGPLRYRAVAGTVVESSM